MPLVLMDPCKSVIFVRNSRNLAWEFKFMQKCLREIFGQNILGFAWPTVVLSFCLDFKINHHNSLSEARTLEDQLWLSGFVGFHCPQGKSILISAELLNIHQKCISTFCFTCRFILTDLYQWFVAFMDYFYNALTLLTAQWNQTTKFSQINNNNDSWTKDFPHQKCISISGLTMIKCKTVHCQNWTIPTIGYLALRNRFKF